MVDLPEEYKELVSGPENVDRGPDVQLYMGVTMVVMVMGLKD